MPSCLLIFSSDLLRLLNHEVAQGGSGDSIAQLVLVFFLLLVAPLVSAYADHVPKAVKLTQLKNDFEKEKAKFEAMPQSKSAEDSAKIEAQGKKVKQLGREAGELESEINPPDPKKVLEDNFRILNGVLVEAAYFKTKVNDTIHGEMYKRGIKIVEQKKIDLAKIENEE